MQQRTESQGHLQIIVCNNVCLTIRNHKVTQTILSVYKYGFPDIFYTRIDSKYFFVCAHRHCSPEDSTCAVIRYIFIGTDLKTGKICLTATKHNRNAVTFHPVKVSIHICDNRIYFHLHRGLHLFFNIFFNIFFHLFFLHRRRQNLYFSFRFTPVQDCGTYKQLGEYETFHKLITSFGMQYTKKSSITTLLPVVTD